MKKEADKKKAAADKKKADAEKKRKADAEKKKRDASRSRSSSSKRVVPTGTWAKKAEKLMGSKNHYYKIQDLPRTERKAEYLYLVRSNMDKLAKIKAPAGMTKEVLKAGHHTIHGAHPKKIFVGLDGASLSCVDKCNIRNIHGFPEGITYK